MFWLKKTGLIILYKKGLRKRKLALTTKTMFLFLGRKKSTTLFFGLISYLRWLRLNQRVQFTICWKCNSDQQNIHTPQIKCNRNFVTKTITSGQQKMAKVNSRTHWRSWRQKFSFMFPFLLNNNNIPLSVTARMKIQRKETKSIYVHI